MSRPGAGGGGPLAATPSTARHQPLRLCGVHRGASRPPSRLGCSRWRPAPCSVAHRHAPSGVRCLAYAPLELCPLARCLAWPRQGTHGAGRSHFRARWTRPGKAASTMRRHALHLVCLAFPSGLAVIEHPLRFRPPRRPESAELATLSVATGARTHVSLAPEGKVALTRITTRSCWCKMWEPHFGRSLASEAQTSCR